MTADGVVELTGEFFQVPNLFLFVIQIRLENPTYVFSFHDKLNYPWFTERFSALTFFIRRTYMLDVLSKVRELSNEFLH